MIEVHVVKEAKEVVLYFVQDRLGHLLGELWSRMTIIKRQDIGVIHSLLTAKCFDLFLS